MGVPRAQLEEKATLIVEGVERPLQK